jgi:hypothetical protein
MAKYIMESTLCMGSQPSEDTQSVVKCSAFSCLVSASLVCGAPWRARALNELGAAPGEVEVLVVNRTTRHSIRVRNYEADLDATRVPLANVPDPIGVAARRRGRIRS